MTIQLRPALEFDLPFLADLFSREFEGYFVPIEESPAGLAARLRYDSIDLALSRVALIDNRAAGVLFVSVRGWNCRIAAMGVVAEARRQGIGRRLMVEAVTQSRAAGLRQMVLEVIEQNEPAAALYRSLGFAAGRRLVGYELPSGRWSWTDRVDRDAQILVQIDPLAVARLVAKEAEPDLPWQLAAETFATRGNSLSAVHLSDKAFALYHDPGVGAALVLEALLIPRNDRRSGWGSRLFQALASRHDGRAWRIPARVPEGLAAPFFSSLGFERLSLSQLEMRLAL